MACSLIIHILITTLFSTFAQGQGCTPATAPQLQLPNLPPVPGFGNTTWAATNAWNGCGIDWQGTFNYDPAKCNIPKDYVVGVQAPYVNSVAIAWFSYNCWTIYNANSPWIRLQASYTYVFSITSNVYLNGVTTWLLQGGTKFKRVGGIGQIRNGAGQFTLNLQKDGEYHFELGFDYGHPSGNITLFQIVGNADTIPAQQQKGQSQPAQRVRASSS